MLRIYSTLLELCREIARRIAIIQQHDADLARQMKRACTSAVLNHAEGYDSLGGNKRLRYHCALGSWGELISGFELADALGYVAYDARFADQMQHVRAVHVKLTKPRR